MKRIIIFLIISVLTAGMVSAQGIRERNDAPNAAPNNRGDLRPNINPDERRDPRQNINPEIRRDPRPNFNSQNRDSNRQDEYTPIVISGTLKLERGFVAIQNDPVNAPNAGSAFYLVPMLNRYIGFINGLREDAIVTIEGVKFRNIIHPTKLTIGDRDYDFPAFYPNHDFGSFHNRQPHGNVRQNMERLRPNNKNENNRENRNRNR